MVAATSAKYSDDGAGRLANLIAYAAFLAVFPLLLVLLTLVEILLFGHRSLQDDVVNAALRQFPEVGDELRHNITGLSGAEHGGPGRGGCVCGWSTGASG